MRMIGRCDNVTVESLGKSFLKQAINLEDQNVYIIIHKISTISYGTPEGTFSVIFLSCTHKLLTRFDNIITRLNDLLSRSNKLFILFKQDNNSFKRLIMSFKQVIYLV